MGHLARRLDTIRLPFCLLAAAALLLAPHIASACLQMYGTDHHGKRVVSEHPEHYLGRFKSPYERANWEAQRDQAAKRVKKTSGDRKAKNDLAVALIHLGDYDEALALLTGIENDGSPPEYATAANLGTLYELRGDNEKALHWITEAMKRNPDSHRGTEWVHVKILEAKIAASADPNWFASHSVLGLRFGGELTPAAPGDDLRGKTLSEVRRAIEYQLEERLDFVKAPDPFVGDLLADLGHLFALTETVELAVPVYELAIEYQTPQKEIVAARKAHFERLIAENPDSGKRARSPEEAILAAVAGGFALAIIASVVGLWHWRRRRRAVAQEPYAV